MKKYISSFILCVICFSCEKDLDYVSSNDAPIHALYSFLEPDSVLKIQICKSSPITTLSASQVAENGWISIFKDSVLISQQYYYGSFGWFDVPSVHVADSSSYQIKFTINDAIELSAETSIPHPVSILEVDTIPGRFFSQMATDTTMICKVSFKDPVFDKNFYQLSVVSLGQKAGLNVSSDISFAKDDKLFLSSLQAESIWKGIDFEGLFTDSDINGLTYTIMVTIPIRYFRPRVDSRQISVEFRLYSLSYEYFQYYRSRKISDGYSGIPILDPVKIYSNVKNGEGCVGALSRNSFFVNLNQ